MRSEWHVYCAKPDAAAIADAGRELVAGTDDSLLVLLAEDGEATLAELVEALRAATTSHFFGGVFPELLVGGRRVDEGALLLRVPTLAPPVAITEFETAGEALEALAAKLRARPETDTLFVLVDGLAPAISTLLEATYDEFGDRVRYWGGGAGTSDFVRRPCLFGSEQGVLEGGALVVATSLHASLGVHHGWRPLAGPLVVTRSEANTVHQLNWQPAAEVYAKHVGEHMGQSLSREKLARVMGRYPLGLDKHEQEFVVRDPVAASEDGSLLCVGDVPQNATLTILQGNPGSLIEAAGLAAREATTSIDGEVRHCLIADCISRVLFLEDDFHSELAAITAGLGSHANASTPIGVLTLGEISSRGDGYLEFFNKTCVVAVLHDH